MNYKSYQHITNVYLSTYVTRIYSRIRTCMYIIAVIPHNGFIHKRIMYIHSMYAPFRIYPMLLLTVNNPNITSHEIGCIHSRDCNSTVYTSVDLTLFC